jgi:hypothetical protein
LFPLYSTTLHSPYINFIDLAAPRYSVTGYCLAGEFPRHLTATRLPRFVELEPADHPSGPEYLQVSVRVIPELQPVISRDPDRASFWTENNPVPDIAEGTALMQAWSWPERRLITRFPVGSALVSAISFSPDGAYLVLHQIDDLERYLWRTEDLITQGCRTLIEIAAARVDLQPWCVAHSQEPSKGPDAARSEPVDSARSRSAR